MNNILKINFSRRRKLTSLLGLNFDGSRLDGVVLRRTNGSLQLQQSFSATLSLDPLTAAPELVGREIRNQLDAAPARGGCREPVATRDGTRISVRRHHAAARPFALPVAGRQTTRDVGRNSQQPAHRAGTSPGRGKVKTGQLFKSGIHILRSRSRALPISTVYSFRLR